jgi:Zn-dependent protease
MQAGSLKLGTWFGIAVRAHWSAALIAALIGTSLAGVVGVTAAMFGMVGFFLSILLHEFAHALTARRFGVETRTIQLWALGGVARLDREAPSAKAEGWIAAAGPISNIVVAVATLGLWTASGGRANGSDLVAMLAWLAVINASLAAFNLLPGAPLDGGRILKAVRWAVHGNRYRASREAARSGMVLGWLSAAAGFALLLQAQTGVWLIVTGLFIAMNARFELAAADVAERLDGLKVRDLTWFGVAAAGVDMDADSMLWDRRRLGMAGGVTVTDRFGRPQGLVLEEQMWAIPADQRPWVMLTQLMVPIDRVAQATPDEDLASVLPRINPVSPAVTVWQNGKLVGIVPPARLRERLAGGV